MVDLCWLCCPMDRRWWTTNIFYSYAVVLCLLQLFLLSPQNCFCYFFLFFSIFFVLVSVVWLFFCPLGISISDGHALRKNENDRKCWWAPAHTNTYTLKMVVGGHVDKKEACTRQQQRWMCLAFRENKFSYKNSSSLVIVKQLCQLRLMCYFCKTCVCISHLSWGHLSTRFLFFEFKMI